MKVDFNSFSSSTISSFKENIRPGLDYKRIIIGIALVALSFMVVTIYAKCCTKVKKPPLKDSLKDSAVEIKPLIKLPDQDIWDKDELDKAIGGVNANKGVKYSSEDPEVMEVASQIVEEVFDVYTNPNRDPKVPSAKLKNFSFQIFHPKAAESAETPPLLVKFKSGAKESVIPLYTILKAIQWNKLDSKWGNLTGEQWKVVSDRSIFDKGYKQGHHYLKAYTGLTDYKIMNLFLRQAKITQGYNGSWNNETINRAAKERLFACLSATGSLKEFQSVASHVKVYRNVKSENAVYLLNKYEVGKIVTEESFLSTAQGGTGFTGDIEYHIKLAPKSRGRSIEGISKFPGEKECLFLPFTSFKVDNFYFVKKSTGALVKTAAFENGSENILNTDIRKIIELSEVQTA